MSEIKKKESEIAIPDILLKYNWETFISAIQYMNSHWNFWNDEKYDLLSKFINKFGYTKELLMSFINKAHQEEKISYQRCLDDILSSVLNNSARYSNECDSLNEIFPAIYFLLDKGANFPDSKLLEKRYNDEKYGLEDEIYDYHIRGLLIDEFHHYLPNIGNYYDWCSITPCDWEYTEEDEEIEISRLRYLKYCSKYLQNKYMNKQKLLDENNKLKNQLEELKRNLEDEIFRRKLMECKFKTENEKLRKQTISPELEAYVKKLQEEVIQSRIYSCKYCHPCLDSLKHKYDCDKCKICKNCNKVTILSYDDEKADI